MNFIAKNPYLKARVKILSDYTEVTEDVLDDLELEVFDELRTNLKLMKHIFPSKNYKLSQAILDHRPSSFTTRMGDRAVKLQDKGAEMERRSKFSYAVLETLQVSPSMKLKLLQEHVLEKRLMKFLEILRAGKDFLEEELVNKGYSSEMCNQIILQSKHESDIDVDLAEGAWNTNMNINDMVWQPSAMIM